jgi:hypothetical protein
MPKCEVDRCNAAHQIEECGVIPDPIVSPAANRTSALQGNMPDMAMAESDPPGRHIKAPTVADNLHAMVMYEKIHDWTLGAGLRFVGAYNALNTKVNWRLNERLVIGNNGLIARF